mgnify:FL=1
MSTGISAFTQAANQAQQWVNELGDDLRWDDRRAYRLLRAVLHGVRDWLSHDEMADLSAQLPLLIRGVYFDGWRPRHTPATDRSKESFVERIRRDMANDPLGDPDRAIAAVFRLLDRHLDEGELVQVRNAMKKALRQLWPAD